VAEKPSDKAPWKQAAQGLFEATLAGALAGETAFPQMELDELVVDWAARPKFLEDGTVLADTDEPKVQPFTTHAVYKRNRTPKLKEP